MDRYSYRVHYSAEDEGFVGTVVEMPSLSHVADTAADALAGIRNVTAFAVKDLQDRGDHPVPEPIAEGRAEAWRDG